MVTYIKNQTNLQWALSSKQNLPLVQEETAVMASKLFWRSHGTQHFKNCDIKANIFTAKLWHGRATAQNFWLRHRRSHGTLLFYDRRSLILARYEEVGLLGGWVGTELPSGPWPKKKFFFGKSRISLFFFFFLNNQNWGILVFKTRILYGN